MPDNQPKVRELLAVLAFYSALLAGGILLNMVSGLGIIHIPREDLVMECAVIVALILSIISLIRISRSGGQLAGKGLAIIALILAILSALFLAVVVMLFSLSGGN
jgi:hypothetical protein